MKQTEAAGRGQTPRVRRLCLASDVGGEGSDPVLLAQLHASLFPDAPWNAASFKELLAHPGAIAFVASAGTSRETVGFIVGRLAADEAEILTLGVAGGWQRAGIGSLLVETFCRAAKIRGARQLHLEVASGNRAARALYDRFGFEERGRRAGYYAHAGVPAEDAINLDLSLASPWRPGGLPQEPHL
jgi:[ribosomal protein S18]-alanine N-acetyltransferase